MFRRQISSRVSHLPIRLAIISKLDSPWDSQWDSLHSITKVNSQECSLACSQEWCLVCNLVCSLAWCLLVCSQIWCSSSHQCIHLVNNQGWWCSQDSSTLNSSLCNHMVRWEDLPVIPSRWVDNLACRLSNHNLAVVNMPMVLKNQRKTRRKRRKEVQAQAPLHRVTKRKKIRKRRREKEAPAEIKSLFVETVPTMAWWRTS